MKRSLVVIFFLFIIVVLISGCTTISSEKIKNKTFTPNATLVPTSQVTLKPEAAIEKPSVNKNDALLAEEWHKKGLALFRKEKYEDTLEYFETALNLDPYNAKILLSKGDVLLKMGKKDEAYEAYYQVVDLDLANNTDLFLKYGAYFTPISDEERIKIYKKIIDMNLSNKAEAWIRIGNVYNKQKNKDEANKAFNKAIEIAPGSYGFCGGEFYYKSLNWCQYRG